MKKVYTEIIKDKILQYYEYKNYSSGVPMCHLKGILYINTEYKETALD